MPVVSEGQLPNSPTGADTFYGGFNCEPREILERKIGLRVFRVFRGSPPRGARPSRRYVALLC
jgi:hypothetical protein